MRQVRIWLRGVLAALAMMLGGAGVAPAQNVTPPMRALPDGPRFLIAIGSASRRTLTEADVTHIPMLKRRVSVMLHQTSVGTVLRSVATQAHVSLAFASEDALTGRMLDVRMENVTLAAVLTEILVGSGVDVLIDGEDRMTLVPRVSLRVATGIVMGRVTERGTNAAVPAAQVTVTGVSSRYTDDKGQYRIANVPVGEHTITVKRVGFEAVSRSIRLGEGETVTADFVMGRVPTTLTEVVTTATGERSRVEVGNSIGTIKADSIVPTTLIRNMSDLLQARTPGVIVSNENGRVGSPSRIRIRGLSSIQLNNDPIIVLDGIRLNWLTTTSGSQTNVGSTNLGAYDTPSRLDDIDPNTIESIDVLRGPSAATLYGTDAANGVIVIKTKKGATGPWHLDLLADAGQSSYPGTFPALWFGWGRTPTGSVINTCSPLSNVSNLCQLDSVSIYGSQSDPNLTGVGTGTSKNLSLNLSGGTPQLQQFFSLRTSDLVGMPKMPMVEQRRVTRMWNETLPEWMVRPNAEQDFDGSSRTNVRIGSTMDLQVSAHGVYRYVREGTSEDNQFRGVTPYQGPWDTLATLMAENMRNKRTGVFRRGFISTSGNYSPTSWLAFNATAGGDYTLRTDNDLQRASDCTVLLAPSTGCVSAHSNKREEAFVTTLTAGAHLSFAPVSGIALRTSIGEQYSGTTFYGLQTQSGGATNLAFGTDLLTPAPVATSGTPQLYAVSESRDQSATAGYYVEQTVAFRERLFLTAAMRQDAASAFGPSINQKLPTYPKFSASWLVSDEPYFPYKALISSFRLRAAYGHSGTQARQTDVLPNYQVSTVVQDNVNTPGIVLSQIPNPVLKPERLTEFEGGLDLSLLENERVHVEATLYRKLSKDAIISLPTPASYGAIVGSRRLNLGSVENRGTEVSFTAKLLDSRAIDWDINANYTENRNTLVAISSQAAITSGAFKIGYPIFANFSNGVPASWYDANGDGILQRSEVTFSSGTPGLPGTANNGQVYFGPPYPRSEITYHTGLTILSGMLRLGAQFDQTNDMTVFDNQVSGARCRITPTVCSLSQQAQEIAGSRQVVSWIRFSELSATYNVPQLMAKRLFHVRSAALSLAGRNLATWTNYRWNDPTGGFATRGNTDLFGGDGGFTLAQPVNWVLRFNVGI